MRLLELKLERFRNLEPVHLVPSVRTTICVGDNGQGKTNLLEALYFLTTLKPLRAAKLQELVRFGEQTAWVQGRFELQGAQREITLVVEEGTRRASVDGKKVTQLESYFGGLATVAFTPDDLRVVKGGPEGRRQFLDRAVFNRFPAFLKESREYLKALKSRNRLLKERAPLSYLDAYEETLARVGARVWQRRRALMTELAPRAEVAFDAIVQTPLGPKYDYAPGLLAETFAQMPEDALQSALREALVSRRGRDLERGFTTVGPHVDDLALALADNAARSFASQGQQRAMVLAWKIAEIENLEASLGFLPLLLLDDVSSELDPDRNAYLMAYLAKRGAQTFLTTTDAHLVRRAAGEDAVWYGVQRGAVQRQKPG